MEVKTYICDGCLKKCKKEEIQKYLDFDLCETCNQRYKKTYLGQDRIIQREIQKLYEIMQKEFPNIYPKWELVNGKKRKFELEKD